MVKDMKLASGPVEEIYPKTCLGFAEDDGVEVECLTWLSASSFSKAGDIIGKKHR